MVRLLYGGLLKKSLRLLALSPAIPRNLMLETCHLAKSGM